MIRGKKNSLWWYRSIYILRCCKFPVTNLRSFSTRLRHYLLSEVTHTMLEGNDNTPIFDVRRIARRTMSYFIPRRRMSLRGQHRWCLQRIYTSFFSPILQTRDITFLFSTTITAIPSQTIARRRFFTHRKRDRWNDPVVVRSDKGRTRNKGIRM